MTPEEIGADLAELKKEIRDELRALKLDIREARLEAREQYNRFRLLIWLPIITGALQVLAAILHR
jgi:hypothetical protein